MIINELLVEKYRVQKALDDATNHNLSEYVKETHIRVNKLGLNFKYGVPGKLPNKNMHMDSKKLG